MLSFIKIWIGLLLYSRIINEADLPFQSIPGPPASKLTGRFSSHSTALPALLFEFHLLVCRTFQHSLLPAVSALRPSGATGPPRLPVSAAPDWKGNTQSQSFLLSTPPPDPRIHQHFQAHLSHGTPAPAHQVLHSKSSLSLSCYLAF